MKKVLSKLVIFSIIAFRSFSSYLLIFSFEAFSRRSHKSIYKVSSPSFSSRSMSQFSEFSRFCSTFNTFFSGRATSELHSPLAFCKASSTLIFVSKTFLSTSP